MTYGVATRMSKKSARNDSPVSTPERDSALSIQYGSRWRSVVAVRDANLFAVGVAATGAAIGECRAIRRTSAVVLLKPLRGFGSRLPLFRRSARC